MACNRRWGILGLLASLLTAAPLWGQNSISISCPNQAAAGSVVTCTMALSLGVGVTVDSLTFGVSVKPNATAPALTSGKLSFSETVSGPLKSTAGTSDSIGVLWTGLSPVLSGSVPLGTLSFTLPASAAGAQTYSAGISGASAGLINKPVNLSIGAAGTISVSASGPLAVSGPSTLPAGTASAGYPSTIVTASGGTAPYSFSATGLPGGLSIGSSGAITGTPAANSAGSYSVQVTVRDSAAATASKSYSLTINVPLVITQPASLPAGIANTVYPTTTVTATGGSGSYTWSATGLPSGMTIAAGTGVISGTPSTNAGSPFSVQVTVTDSNLAPAGKTYSLTINGPVTITGPAALLAATANAVYPATTVTATGGTGSYTWTATGLPNGMSIAPGSGVISGTPTAIAGSPFQVLVTVTDGAGAKASRSYTLTVTLAVGPVSVFGPASLPAGTVGVAYTATTVTATGGSGVYTWSATGLPAGMAISSADGIINGTPSTSSGSPLTVLVTVTDSNLATANRTYTLLINPITPTLPLIVSISNSAGGQSVVAPNTWVSIYGSNFGPTGFTDDWSKSIVDGKLPVSLDGVSVTFGVKAAYVFYVSAVQINVLLPDVGFGPMPVTVTTPAGTSTPLTVTSQQYSPAFFPWPNGQPVATHLDYTPAVKDGTFPGPPTIPAKPGEFITLWGTGFGPTNPAAPVGVATPATTTYFASSPVTVTIGGQPASVYGTALASGFAGLYQVVVNVPASLSNGDYTVLATVNGSQAAAAILTVHN